ncbi:histidine phosphatase family protein [Polynucleobacter brandtiae]|uniref:Histidine phosphatase superfamily protein (Branch 1) n=1 Tax=Polynucleobacter brandtiae TaxID=1938816 RepID=A0A2M8VZP0_9BURK|nr:histidine phosphatase family protein [Polynucleobacter brandtiae]PJI83319.1 histidine phosphatase superfamily protein (branch 1) [Polynucleobacter brandtiae]
MKSLFLSLTTLLFLQSTATLAQLPLADALKDGQHVLLMRHADAPGYGDPAGYQLNQCATQRNLGEYGRKQAKATGVWLTTQGIDQAKVFSSSWCRCLDTATLLDKGAVIKEAALGSFFDDMSQSKKQTHDLAKLIAQEQRNHPNTPIIMVTHHVNIQSFTGTVVNSGDMVLVKVDRNGKALSHKLYPSP